ncbi:hypothetical protein ARMGADRAFT_1059259 [Armillaria gallica]|uniref:Uncharacterized protein n=1 Tax=Armillaria gallica TaxID=47427 RepID=A0A2H3EEW2_ARMGA|nr:hypothetical protein ARMGADRAFT_1059259 [Armillaria gallica]
MFPCSSFSLSTLLYVLSYLVYQASIPSTDVSRRWEAPVPAVVFDYRVQDTNEDLELSEDNTITPGVISGLLEPTVLVHTNLDRQTRLSNDVAITVEDTPSQGIIRQLLEPAIIETLAKHGSRFPLIAPTTRLKDESDSPTHPARRCLPPSKFPRWRG